MSTSLWCAHFIPLQTVAPGLVLMLAILAINFAGDGLRDALDPRGAF